ncbi:MAG: phosphohydrolase [Bacteroidetes bacterium MedPE-SWsnd-G2]|nr:MAG: phosphohydrolase [Bacteroidetes bacterium MedPE-SWsnd-G2]
MSQLLNKWYKNHSLAYKLILFVSTIVFIVYLFPKSGKFKYSFDKGKPWQSENLYAPFDFAIKKSAEELEEEQQEIVSKSPVYFDRSLEIKSDVLLSYEKEFEALELDSLTMPIKSIIYNLGESVLNEVYEKGVLDEDYNYNKDKTCIVLEDQKQVETVDFTEFTKINDVRELVENELNKNQFDEFSTMMVSLFFDIIKPNIALNSTITEQSLQEEVSKISPTRGIIERETLIIAKGEIVEGENYAILLSLESEYESQTWSASNYNLIIFAYSILVALTLLMLLLFLRKYRPNVFYDNKKVSFIFFNVVLMIVLTTAVTNYNSQYVYVVPLCVLPLVLKAFFDARLGLFSHVLTVLLLGFVVPNSYEYMFLQIIAGMVTILTVTELYKRANLFISVGQITLIYIIAYFSFYVIHEGSIANIRFETFGMFILGGLATLFVQPLIYIYEKLFGLVSDVSLLELSDTNSKLLKELANKAPGTFHHSLNVANLAEAAANEIGANAMLVRVGALYHDIGKMVQPTYFTENQSTGINPHDELSPVESASIILNHVIDGIEIAKKNKLPDRLIDFIRTHHGTSMVYYFYMKQKEFDSETSEEDFRYIGPKPFNKETAILMMCDSVEAASKSLKEPSSTKIDSFVDAIIKKQMEDGQFLNADITFKEIESIKKVLKNKLANIFHLRIEYPE